MFRQIEPVFEPYLMTFKLNLGEGGGEGEGAPITVLLQTNENVKY
jgi:hypothetical protein